MESSLSTSVESQTNFLQSISLAKYFFTPEDSGDAERIHSRMIDEFNDFFSDSLDSEKTFSIRKTSRVTQDASNIPYLATVEYTIEMKKIPTRGDIGYQEHIDKLYFLVNSLRKRGYQVTNFGMILSHLEGINDEFSCTQGVCAVKTSIYEDIGALRQKVLIGAEQYNKIFPQNQETPINKEELLYEGWNILLTRLDASISALEERQATHHTHISTRNKALSLLAGDIDVYIRLLHSKRTELLDIYNELRNCEETLFYERFLALLDGLSKDTMTEGVKFLILKVLQPSKKRGDFSRQVLDKRLHGDRLYYHIDGPSPIVLGQRVSEAKVAAVFSESPVRIGSDIYVKVSLRQSAFKDPHLGTRTAYVLKGPQLTIFELNGREVTSISNAESVFNHIGYKRVWTRDYRGGYISDSYDLLQTADGAVVQDIKGVKKQIAGVTYSMVTIESSLKDVYVNEQTREYLQIEGEYISDIDDGTVKIRDKEYIKVIGQNKSIFYISVDLKDKLTTSDGELITHIGPGRSYKTEEHIVTINGKEHWRVEINGNGPYWIDIASMSILINPDGERISEISYPVSFRQVNYARIRTRASHIIMNEDLKSPLVVDAGGIVVSNIFSGQTTTIDRKEYHMMESVEGYSFYITSNLEEVLKSANGHIIVALGRRFNFGGIGYIEAYYNFSRNAKFLLKEEGMTPVEIDGSEVYNLSPQKTIEMDGRAYMSTGNGFYVTSDFTSKLQLADGSIVTDFYRKVELSGEDFFHLRLQYKSFDRSRNYQESDAFVRCSDGTPLKIGSDIVVKFDTGKSLSAFPGIFFFTTSKGHSGYATIHDGKVEFITDSSGERIICIKKGTGYLVIERALGDDYYSREWVYALNDNKYTILSGVTKIEDIPRASLYGFVKIVRQKNNDTSKNNPKQETQKKEELFSQIDHIPKVMHFQTLQGLKKVTSLNLNEEGTKMIFRLEGDGSNRELPPQEFASKTTYIL